MVPMAAEKAAAIIARIPAAVVNSFFGFVSKGVPQYAQKLLVLSCISLPHLVQFNCDLASLLGVYRLVLRFAIYVFTRIQEVVRTYPL